VLEEARKALQAMSAACAAIRVEEWGEAERALHEVQETVGRLLREVGEKRREATMPPRADKGGSSEG
jgi:hypothetical protein